MVQGSSKMVQDSAMRDRKMEMCYFSKGCGLLDSLNKFKEEEHGSD